MKQGWEIKSLGEIADVEYGFTDKSTEEGNYRYVRITDINSNGELISTEKKYLKHSKEAEGFLIRDNDLLMARTGATFAKVLLYEDIEPSVFASYLIRIKFREKIENKLYWYFTKTNSYWEQANSLASGAAQPHFNGAAVKQVIFSYPKSLSEQQRIVGILDEAFTAIAKANANAEQNLRNAKQLFESYLQGVFENKGEGWEEKRFDEICVLQRGFDLPTHSRNEGIFPLVSSNGITDRIDLWKVKAPGVVTGRSGTIGNVHFIIEDYWPLNTALFIKEFHGNDEKFVYYFLKQFNLGKYSSGAGVPTLNRNNVHSEKVWVPISNKVQHSIVQKLDRILIKTRKLEGIYEQKISDLEDLKKSILQKAFSGELKMDKQLA